MKQFGSSSFFFFFYNSSAFDCVFSCPKNGQKGVSLIFLPRNCRLVRATETVEKFNYKSYNEFHSLLINHGKTSLCHDAATESLIINFLPANSQITTISAQ